MQSKDWFKFTHKSSIKEKSRCSDKRFCCKIKCYKRLYHPKPQIFKYVFPYLTWLIWQTELLLNISSKSNRISSYSNSSSYALLKSYFYLLFLLHTGSCWYATANLICFIKTVIDLKFCSVINNIFIHLVCNLKISRGSWRRDDEPFSSKKTPT